MRTTKGSTTLLSARGDGRRRVVIEGISPSVDAGAYPVKRIVGETMRVEATLMCDGHDVVAGVLQFRRPGERDWTELRLEAIGNDRFTNSFELDAIGRWTYRVCGWVDHFAGWQSGLRKKWEAGVSGIDVDLRIGVELVRRAVRRAPDSTATSLKKVLHVVTDKQLPLDERIQPMLAASTATLMEACPDRQLESVHPQEFAITVDRPRAQFSAWYELFPRSWGEPGQHGSFRDVIEHLPYVADMGFDVLYLPPIHPIGSAFRKGKNNALYAAVDDVGSPWAIGNIQGGHKAIHPELGTLEDLHSLVGRARELGLDVALDIAFQASPDHPYVKEHPEWFARRPDGSIQYAENPPKKYQDIYPFDFETKDWKRLWEELRSVFEFWIEQGIRIFRVDNPHTKAFPFWAWCIETLKDRHPDLIFLSEAFTRPHRMYLLAKLGFSQSYTYFTWRYTKHDFIEYLTELTKTEVAEYFRPNFWPNTPDILPPHLQHGGPPAFRARLIMAATLSANYGIYGPAFELMERTPREGVEEYIDNEKYQLRAWNREHRDSLRPLITRVNRIRRNNPALQSDHGLTFHAADNGQLLAYSKRRGDNVVIVVVNLDPFHRQSGWVDLNLESLGLDSQHPFEVHDLVSEDRYQWQGARNFVSLDPHIMPAHVFRTAPHEPQESEIGYGS